MSEAKHDPAFCDFCEEVKKDTVVYKCENCNNFNLCDDCFDLWSDGIVAQILDEKPCCEHPRFNNMILWRF